MCVCVVMWLYACMLTGEQEEVMPTTWHSFNDGRPWLGPRLRRHCLILPARFLCHYVIVVRRSSVSLTSFCRLTKPAQVWFVNFQLLGMAACCPSLLHLGFCICMLGLSQTPHTHTSSHPQPVVLKHALRISLQTLTPFYHAYSSCWFSYFLRCTSVHVYSL